ncbi:MAG TPA: hypothetical protein PLT64_10085 [Syntrophales bacterium]|nr:hypothetical protein [Syntrophales bacterium]HOL60195.1 hypothetical protein [Syntrophales bacterium]HPO36321.1 hypothetical protein [Syntrophales bacterium]
MTISTHYIDNVIKAYTKQQKNKPLVDVERERTGRDDAVTISGNERASENRYEKISYTLVDILTKQR